nr:type II toxin-antitoxin system RelE/ParE family toxin [Alcanivorax sp. DSM 26293]
MIRSFRHKGLARFFRSGNTAGIQAAHAKRLRLILGRLHAASDARDMDLPGSDCIHLWATVSGYGR